MLPADKGRVTVVMDKTDYFDEMDALVNDDKRTYKELKGLITWRISARAEISIQLTGLKFCCDYMTDFSPR